MIPANDNLLSADKLKRLKHLSLVGGVDCLNTDCGLQLRHGEDINDLNRVLVDEFAKHDPHHFERNATAAVLHHFKQG